jgi:hypothetical protein
VAIAVAVEDEAAPDKEIETDATDAVSREVRTDSPTNLDAS